MSLLIQGPTRDVVRTHPRHRTLLLTLLMTASWWGWITDPAQADCVAYWGGCCDGNCNTYCCHDLCAECLTWPYFQQPVGNEPTYCLSTLTSGQCCQNGVPVTQCDYGDCCGRYCCPADQCCDSWGQCHDGPHSDGDTFADCVDNCPTITNQDQADADGDGVGDVCDNCPNTANPPNTEPTDCNNDEDTTDPGEAVDEQCDEEGDGVGDACDNCPYDPNGPNSGQDNQLDTDEDGFGDACDCCEVNDSGNCVLMPPTDEVGNCSEIPWIAGGCLGFLPSYADPVFLEYPDYYYHPESALNLDLSSQGPFPVDLPPRKTRISESSSPLVSAEARSSSGPVKAAERPMFNDIYDLVTGFPLLQEMVFELPFGGAVFRHVRTYGASPTESETMIAGDMDDYIGVPERAHWDWNGLRWMMSENPILLIDASYYWNVDLPKKCYFIPDMHHSIPFEYNEDTQQYTAPDWYDAVLEYDGEPQQPSKYRVRLHHGSITYTFSPHYEDVPDYMHLPETDPWGIPTDGCKYIDLGLQKWKPF